MSQENESGLTEASEENEVVPFNEVSDEDLTAYLQAEQDAEQYPAEDIEEPDAIGKEAQTQSATQQTPQEDLSTPITRAEYNELLKRLESQQKKVDGQEILIHRRTSELGEVKKRLAALDETLQEKYQEALTESPNDALDIRDAIKENRQKLKEVENEEKILIRRSQAQEVVAAHVPEEDFDVEAMAETLSRDGIPPQYIEAFKQDPIGFVDGDYSPGLMLVHVARRAKAEKALSQVFPIAKKLLARVKELEGKESDVLKRVQQVAKQTPQITASGSRPSRNGKALSIDPSQIHTLSEAELEEILASEKN